MVFILQDCLLKFIGDLFITSWESPLPIISDMGAQQLPVLVLQYGGVGCFKKRLRQAVPEAYEGDHHQHDGKRIAAVAFLKGGFGDISEFISQY